MAEEVVYSLASIQTNNPSVRASLDAAQAYLTDSKGASLQLSSDQFAQVREAVFNLDDSAVLTNTDLARLNAASFEQLHNDIRASTWAMQEEVRAVGSLVAACHEDTVIKLNEIQSSIDQVNKNVVVLGSNIDTVAGHLLQLQRDFNSYVAADARANSVQRAETKLIQLRQQLEGSFSQHKELRAMASGVLVANDLNIRTETILTSAEESCIKTPRYWLAPALVALASWIVASREIASGKPESDREVQMAVGSMKRMLKEAYIRECSKTTLFFGLVCRRANDIPEANRWFAEYLEFQNPRKVDHTCIVLLNAYAAGLMGRGAEERAVLDTMASWFEELMSDADGKYKDDIVNDWKKTCIMLYTTARPSSKTYQALPEFCVAEDWARMKQVMQATSLHRELKSFLEKELASRDFAEDDLTVIDSMITDLVTEFDADELPIRREQEYQQLIIDLDGNEQLAKTLRNVKDDILSETKSFSSLLSDAARESDLSHASAATHVYAIKVQMPLIKEAYEQTTQIYRNATPQTINASVGDFQFSTTDGSNETQVVNNFVAFVNNQEREQLEASKTGVAQKVALIGGAALALIGFIVAFAVGGGGWVLVLLGGIAAAYGLISGSNARKRQAEIQATMESKRQNGVLVIRKFMAEVRDWRAEYAANEALMPEVLADMNRQSVQISEVSFNGDN